MNNYYVYVYLDPRSNPPEPIYVGKGHGKRYKDHITKGAKNKHLKNKLNKIQEAGLQPIIEFPKKNISDAEAILLEIELIAKYGRIDKKTGTLCNWTDGGDGTSGYKHKDETKKLFSKQRKGKPQTPKQYEANCGRKPISEETRLKMSLANKGHARHTPEQIAKLKQFNLGSKRTEETKKLMSLQRKGKKQTEAQYQANCSRDPKNTKQIVCVNNNKIYKSIKSAANELNLSPSAIGAVARGMRKHHKNYIFKFL